MEILIEAADDAVARQVEQLLHFYLTGLGETDRIDIRIEAGLDPLGTPLYDCRLRARTRNGAQIALTESQSHLVLAISRLLDRTVRTLRRRAAPARPHLSA